MEKKFQMNFITLRNFSPHFANSVIPWNWFYSRSITASLSLFLCKTTTKSKIVMFNLCLQWELLHLAQLEKKVSCVIFVLPVHGSQYLYIDYPSWYLFHLAIIPGYLLHGLLIPIQCHTESCWGWRQKEKPIILTLFKNLIFVDYEFLLHIWFGKVYFNMVVFRPLILYA